MEKKNLTHVMSGFLFRVPDYQRGYAWEERQWKDFTQDIDALIDDNVRSHYTGTLVIYQPKTVTTENYGTKKFEVVDIVDGQQRLTTSSLYLSIILNKLIESGEVDYSNDRREFIFCGSKSKLSLNNDTNDLYFDLISSGVPRITPNTVHQQRLSDAYDYLKRHIEEETSKKEDALGYLKNLYDAITRKLHFSFYAIEEESEIGMTFELMNSRGKGLSVLELLKNYLMYWIYRNAAQYEKNDMPPLINKSWKEVYTNIAKCKGSENQCLRIAWILYHSHTPKNWQGYAGFKDDNVIPIRDFTKRSKEDTARFIRIFSDGLSKISYYYSLLMDSTDQHNIEDIWITKIKNAGNIANFLPLMVAAKIKLNEGKIKQEEYIELLKSMELYSFRVFLWAGKRSNAGISAFYRWAAELFSGEQSITFITSGIYDTCNWYSNEYAFRDEVAKPYGWYYKKGLLKYCLFEYELYLLQNEGKGLSPKLKWSELTDITIEHILPQNPNPASQWKIDWCESDMNEYLHDISNLVLTMDNSCYSNFDFARKKGSPGSGHCYSNSDIRQERKIAEYASWNIENCKARKTQLSDWIISRWGIERHLNPTPLDDSDDSLPTAEETLN